MFCVFFAFSIRSKARRIMVRKIRKRWRAIYHLLLIIFRFAVPCTALQLTKLYLFSLPLSLACCNKSIIACPLRTPGWILSGRLGNDSKAHSSVHGMPTSLLIPPLRADDVPVVRPTACDVGVKAFAKVDDAVEARKIAIENFIVLFFWGVLEYKQIVTSLLSLQSRCCCSRRNMDVMRPKKNSYDGKGGGCDVCTLLFGSFHHSWY